jgi:Ca2+/Na+ antiporter
VAVLKIVVSFGMLVVVIGCVVVINSRRQPPRRRRIAQRVMVLAMAVVLAFDAITQPHLRWFNTGMVVFTVGAILFQVWWERRRKTP